MGHGPRISKDAQGFCADQQWCCNMLENVWTCCKLPAPLCIAEIMQRAVGSSASYRHSWRWEVCSCPRPLHSMDFHNCPMNSVTWISEIISKPFFVLMNWSSQYVSMIRYGMLAESWLQCWWCCYGTHLDSTVLVLVRLELQSLLSFRQMRLSWWSPGAHTQRRTESSCETCNTQKAMLAPDWNMSHGTLRVDASTEMRLAWMQRKLPIFKHVSIKSLNWPDHFHPQYPVAK